MRAGLSADSQPNSQNDNWMNGEAVTDEADAALAERAAQGDNEALEDILLAIAHQRLERRVTRDAVVFVPSRMNHWTVESDRGQSVVTAASDLAAIVATADKVREAISNTGKAARAAGEVEEQ